MAIGNTVRSNQTSFPDNLEDRILKGMNPEQIEVIQHVNGPLLAAAVAGAGKTAALVRRIARLVKVEGIKPSRILAVTFSRKGADEMNDRLKGFIGETEARVGTFHSLALEIHRTEMVDESGEWEWAIDDKNRYRIIVKDTVGYKELKWGDADVTYLESYIGFCKAQMAPDGSDKAMEIAEEWYRRAPDASKNPLKVMSAYVRAEEIRRERHLLTFDDMLLDAVELMNSSEDIRLRWAGRYDYVLQDEAQDQNLCQLMMGDLLARDHKNYMLVGDPAQTIYTWRGAEPGKLLGFTGEWGAKQILMNRNYRCGQVIIDAANKSLASMDPTTRLDMEMKCERGTPGKITSLEYGNLDEEAQSLAHRIDELLAQGIQAREIAVLYRTNAQSRAPEEALIGRRIPYRIIGGANFYERREIKNLLAYLRLADGRGDDEDMSRCINAPFRFLGRAFIDKVKEATNHLDKGTPWEEVIEYTAKHNRNIQGRQIRSAHEWADLVDGAAAAIRLGASAPEGDELCRLARPARLLNDIVRETKYQQFLQKEEGEESTENSRCSNVREMIRAAERFLTVGELLDYVDKQLFASKRERKEKDPNKVTLCSLHRSKGLEWPIVNLIGCANGILPHGRAEDPEEERRLFYVGVTRARDELHLSYASTMAMGNALKHVDASEFLHVAGLAPVRASQTDDWYEE